MIRRSGYSVALWAWSALGVVFLFLPIVTAVVYSFNAGVGGRQSAAFTGWSAAGYSAAFADGSLRTAAEVSLVVAFWSALLSLALGSALGFALVRHPSRVVRRVLAGFTYVLLIVPETVIGVSLLLMYTETHIPLGGLTLIAGHTPPSVSIVAFVVRARLLTLDPQIEEAAADLGADRWQQFRLVVLPQLLPSVAAGALLAYAFSFDNVVISNFLSTAQVSTLPVYLYGSLQYGPTPAVYAAAALIFAFTVLVLAVAGVLLRAVVRQRAVLDTAVRGGTR